MIEYLTENWHWHALQVCLFVIAGLALFTEAKANKSAIETDQETDKVLIKLLEDLGK